MVSPSRRSAIALLNVFESLTGTVRPAPAALAGTAAAGSRAMVSANAVMILRMRFFICFSPFKQNLWMLFSSAPRGTEAGESVVEIYILIVKEIHEKVNLFNIHIVWRDVHYNLIGETDREYSKFRQKTTA